jgi:preprotein translocase subunit SecG
MKIALLNIAFLLMSAFAFTQTLNTVVSKPEIDLGERVRITFSVQSEEPIDSIAYIEKRGVFEAKDSGSGDTTSISSLYELEIMSSFKDTTYKEGETHIWKGVYEVTGWDSAYVVIPPEQIIVDDSVMYFPAALIEVATPKADPSKPIFDINEEFTEVDKAEGFEAFVKKHWWWMALALLLVVLIFWLILKKKQKPIQELSLRHKTLKEIDELEKSKSYEKNLKEYYFDLSIILRKFFSVHYQERMLDKTTSEIELILAQKGLERSTVDVVRNILTQSDQVKFAKSEPPLSDVFVVTNDARRIVNVIAALVIADE